MSSDEFGTTTLSEREVRTLLLGSGVALLLLMVFGLALAVRLASSIEPVEQVSAVAATAESGPEQEAASVMATPDTGRGTPEVTPERTAEGPGASPATSLTIEGDPLGVGTRGARYGVRVGIFAVPANADRILLQLQAQGYAPFVVVRREGGGTHRYVYAASARTELAAESLAQVVRRETGLPTHVEPISEPG